MIGEVAAGRPFAGDIGAGQAARIFTGGVLPPGADTVVIQELTERDGVHVIIQAATAPKAASMNTRLRRRSKNASFGMLISTGSQPFQPCRVGLMPILDTKR